MQLVLFPDDFVDLVLGGRCKVRLLLLECERSNTARHRQFQINFIYTTVTKAQNRSFHSPPSLRAATVGIPARSNVAELKHLPLSLITQGLPHRGCAGLR